MAVVTSDFLAGLFTNFRVIWEDAFLAASSMNTYDRYCTTVPSDTDTESYNWLSTVPKMKEWLDERQFEGLTQYNYSIKNKSFEVSIEVNREALEDDKYGMIRPRIAQLGQEAARYPAELAITTLAAGDAAACYDGANYFATTHSEESSGTQSNLLTGSGTTLSAFRTDFLAMRTAMRRFKDGKGRTMNLRPDLVIIPPELQDITEQLFNTNIIALSSGSQQSNILQGTADVMVDPYLTDVNDWYGLCTTQVLKPLIFQQRKAPEFVSLDNPTDVNAFLRKKFFYGVDSRFNVGYGIWQLAVKTTN